MLVECGRVAANPWERLVGLLPRATLPQGDGLLLRNEQAIHTLGMRFAIDVAYLDGEARIVKLVSAMPPMRLGPFVRSARAILEVPAGTFENTGTRLGDHLEITVA